MSRINKTPQQKLIDSLNRLEGQVKALAAMLEHLDWDNPQQVKKVSALFKAVRSAAESNYDRFKDAYLQHRLSQVLREVTQIAG